MSEIMRMIPFDKLMNWMLTEYKESGSIFGIKKNKFYKNESGTYLEIFGDKISSPVGPAAGPNSQLAQNIVSSYLGGARFIELKTVQIMDGEELRKCVPRPCINAEDECYNVEWSTELYVPEAFAEYVKAWFACQVIAKELGISASKDFIFNISLGYDLEGIKSEKIDKFVEGMKDASNTEIFKTCKNYLLNNLDKFNNVDKDFVESISPVVSPSVTLSTLHGCPPEEIEKISRYLISEKKMHTYIKCNPTLLGYEFARTTLDKMGYDYLGFDDHHFNDDLQYKDAIPMFKRLIDFSAENNVEFGLKITNTFPVQILRNELPGEEMYMSGRSLFPLSISLANKLSKEFEGKLTISYSGGAEYFNIEEIVKSGIRPVTVATTILKPGGYERLNQLAKTTESLLDGKFKKMNLKVLDKLVKNVTTNSFHVKDMRVVGSRKTDSKLELADCFKAPCKDGGCPIEQQIPEYLNLVANGKFAEAFDVIAIDNAAPSITGTICDHQCQHKCTRLDYDKPLQIRSAKLVASDNAQSNFTDQFSVSELKTDKKVAIVGAGAAGISTALYLRRNGVSVTIFEKRSKPYGIVEYTIPEFRIKNSSIKRDYDMAVKTGVEFKFNTKIDSIDKLKVDYGYVVIAVGSWGENPYSLTSKTSKTYDALKFLEEAKEKDCKLDLGKEVIVIGGGDVSMDAARSAKRALNNPNVTLVYRRTKANMPATHEEIVEAIEENISFHYLRKINSFENGIVVIEKTKLVDGRAKATGETYEMKVDTIINAIGAKVETGFFTANKIELNKYNTPVINENNESSVTNVYVAGDCKVGPKTVVKALADGKKVAIDILNKLGLSNDFVRVNYPIDKEILFNKKGILIAKLADKFDGSRCLSCDQICDLCADVCPNRANLSIRVPSNEFAQATQILHVDGMCNECGNCGVFCPHSGNPYKDKTTLFWSLEDLKDSENIGFVKLDDKNFKVRTEDGKIVDYKLGDSNISSTLITFINAVVDEYEYLF